MQEYNSEPYECEYGVFKVAPRVIIPGYNHHTWYLAGEKGAMQFKIMPIPLRMSMFTIEIDGESFMGVDIGYHSPKPMFDGHEPMDSCDLFDGVPCYYGGSSLAATRLMEKWAEAGCDDNVIWHYLASDYNYHFNEGRP